MKEKQYKKMLSMLEKIDGKNRYYIFIALLLAVFLLDYFFLMSPQLKALRKISPEIKIVSGDIKKAKEDLKKLNDYREDLKRLNKKLDEASRKVKSRDEVPGVIEHIAHIASETGVNIDQIMPDSIAQELLTENNQRRYFDLPIYLEARGGYHNFGRFLSKIEQDEVSLRVGNFLMVSTGDTRLHMIKLTLKATVFEEVQR